MLFIYRYQMASSINLQFCAKSQGHIPELRNLLLAKKSPYLFCAGINPDRFYQANYPIGTKQ